MKWPSGVNTASLYVEIRQRSLRVLYGEENLVIPIERQPTGRLSELSKGNVIAILRGLLKKKSWRPRARAFCAIEARGVSIRRLSLPASADGDLQRVLRLQIESEFPLPPSALAWGYSQVPGRKGKSDGSAHSQPGASAGPASGKGNDFMIVALKKEVLEDYAQMFAGAGVTPVFTVAALMRSEACPRVAESYSVLDIGRTQSELISFRDGIAESLRVIAWGGDSITRSIEQNLGITRDEAEKLKLQFDHDTVPNGEVGNQIKAAIGESLVSLASAIASNWKGEKLYLTGRGSRYSEMPGRLAERLAGGVICERVEPSKAQAPTAAILGLKKCAESDRTLPVVLHLKDSKGSDPRSDPGQGPWNSLGFANAELREIAAQPSLRKWARLAVLLCVCLLCFPYVRALLFKPFLVKKLATIRKEKGRLAIIDRELTFLQYLKNVQPPFLDALTVLANAASPGTRFDSISLNRRGELALKGNMGNAQQVVDFRAKLIKSTFFSAVTVEEQTPSPDRQRMTVRIFAQCKPALALPRVKVEPLPPGFIPGGSGMPFPGMMGGGPVTAFPGAMPGPTSPMSGIPPGAIPRPGPHATLQTRYGLSGESGSNTTETPKPVVVEETKKQ